MSSSLNKVQLIGNIGKEPITRYMANGDAVTNITLATTETWKDKDEQKQEKTEWHNITFFRKLAEIVQQYVKKGQTIYVEGRLATRKWTDKDGIERYTTEIIATDMKMFGKKPSGEQQPGGEQQSSGTDSKGRSYNSESRPPAQKTGTGFDDMDDDIPF